MAASDRRVRVCGAVAAGCFVAHGAVHLWHGEAFEMLWACNFASLVIAVGALAASRTAVAVGLYWLSLGVPLWIYDLTTGGVLMPSSLLTHVVAPLAAVTALARLGWPSGSWSRGLVALAALLVATRALTPGAANVNLAFRVWKGFEQAFPSHAVYLTALTALSGALFFSVDRAATWLSSRPAAAASPAEERTS